MPEVLNILEVLSHKSWSADRACLLHPYNALVRLRLDYGAPVCVSARPCNLETFEPVHHLGIRLATGAFRTSPFTNVHAESEQITL